MIFDTDSRVKNNWDENSIILTFDDGLKDHIMAAKLLRDLGVLSACFYIPTLPYTDGVILSVHTAQFIRSKFGGKSLMLLEDASKVLGISLAEHRSFENEKKSFSTRYASQIDDPNTKEFKRLINYYGDRDLRDILLDKILEIAQLDIHFSDVYLSMSEILEISSMGFEIGSHGSSHIPFSRLSAEDQCVELSVSREYLQGITGKSVNSFCYPYGGKSSYNKSTLTFLRDLGYTNAISVEHRDILPEDLVVNPYEIPRYDCNQLASLYSIPC